MRKGQKQSPLPAPALTEKDRAHQWRSQCIHDLLCQDGGYIHGRSRLAHPRITCASCCEGRHNPNKHSSRLCLFGSPDLRTAHVVHPHGFQTYPYSRVGASPSRGGGRHPLRLAARTIRSMTTCDPRCWRFASRNASAASASATRPAGTEISRCPLFPFSERRVIFIFSSLGYLRIYIIVYHIHQR